MNKRLWIIPALIFGMICLVTPLTLLADEASPSPEPTFVILDGSTVDAASNNNELLTTEPSISQAEKTGSEVMEMGKRAGSTGLENFFEQNSEKKAVEQSLEQDALVNFTESPLDFMQKNESDKVETSKTSDEAREEEAKETTEAAEKAFLLNTEPLIGQQNLGQPEFPEIYLDGQKGNDDNDGFSKESAFKSFEEAKETAKLNQGIKEIRIMGTVNISGELSLHGTNARVIREKSFKDYLFAVSKDSVATLSDITIDGNFKEARDSTEHSLIHVLGILNIEDGTVLKNNHFSQKAIDSEIARGGAIKAGKDAIINMTGGLIENNLANKGGGVYLYQTTMNMSGGAIKNNKAVNRKYNKNNLEDKNNMAGAGGAVLLTSSPSRGSTLNFFGNALIQGNYAQEVGGGISVSDLSASGNDRLNMWGGVIDGNTAGATGGGIFVQAGYGKNYGKATISAGQICNNKTDTSGHTNNAFGGGGIYVNGFNSNYGYSNGELHLTNAVIRDNSAKWQGGGYAACPVSRTHIFVSDGAAIYANKAPTAQEIYILANNYYGGHSGSPFYTISDKMLGGQLYNWKNYQDQYLSSEQLSGVLDANKSEYLSLHTDEIANANVSSLMRVLIFGNTSVTRGGGIGSNGSVYIGLKDTTEVEVNKNWNDDASKNTRPESITVILQRQLKDVDEKPQTLQSYIIKADDNGDWKLRISDLAKFDIFGNEYIYSILEEAIDGYEAEITGDQIKGFEIINSFIHKTNVPVKKVWVDFDNKHDLRPDQIVINLLADGIRTGKELTLNAGNSWNGTFTDLDLLKDGVKILYTVEEKNVPESYTTVLSGNAEEGFIITNSYAPPETPEGPPVTPPETPEEPPVTPPETPDEPPVTPPETPEEPPVTPPETPEEPPVTPNTPPEEPLVVPPTFPTSPTPPAPPAPPTFLPGSAPKTFDSGMNGPMMFIVLGFFSLLGLEALRRRKEREAV